MASDEYVAYEDLFNDERDFKEIAAELRAAKEESRRPGDWFLGNKLPTFREEREAKESGRKIKGAPQKYKSIYDQIGLSR